ncbi:MAG: hypothetical protein PVH37_19085 [Desulfobacterales bacterium]|jgi:hypothetical protein
MQTTKSWQIDLTVWITIVIVSFAFAATAMNAAAEEVTYEGTIEGLNCTYYSQQCPKDDLDIYAALENDFVLVLPDGKFFLLPNLSPLVKARHLTEIVRIQGKQDGSNIWVENLEVKQNGGYKNAWNRERQEAGVPFLRNKVPMK